MANPAYTTLSKVNNVGDSLLNSEIENNIKWYLDWGLLGIGGWSDVSIPTPGAYGGTFDSLRPVQDPAYTDGQVWETARKDWVWETGTAWSGSEVPVQISGTYVNSVLYGTGDATYGHHYDYPLGRVIFDSPIDTTKNK